MPFKGGVAVCMTGRSSTLMSKPVRGSFVTNALAPLKANGTAVDLFLVLSGVPTASRDALGVLVKRAYPVSNMGFLDAVTEEPKCPFDARSKDTKMGPKSFSAAKRPASRNERLRLLGQLHALRKVYELVEAAEVARAMKYAYIVRMRTDLVLLNPIPEPRSLHRGGPSVAYGESYLSASKQCQNDNIFVCPRRQCRPYFSLSELWTSSHCTNDPAVPESTPEGRVGPPTAPFRLPLLPSGFSAQWYMLLRYGGHQCAKGERAVECCGTVHQTVWQYGMARGNATHGIVQLDRYQPGA